MTKIFSKAALPSVITAGCLFLTACAVTTGQDISDAQAKGLPILVTNMDSYIGNPDAVKVSDQVKTEASNPIKNSETLAVNEDNNLDITQEEKEVVGLYIRFINLQDQAIENIDFSLQAYNDDLALIDLDEKDAQILIEQTADVTEGEADALSEESKKAPAQTTFASFITVDAENDILRLKNKESIKSQGFNKLNYGSFFSLSNNTDIHCVRLIKVSITNEDGNTQEFEGDDVLPLLSSSQVPRCIETS